MSVLQSKDVDLVIDKNRKIDLYDEQIYDNKQKASQNETKIGNILGRLQTVETFINSFENRVTVIEKGSSGTGVSNTDFARLKSDVNNNISPQVTTNKNDIADVKNRTSRLENNYTAVSSTVDELNTQVQDLQVKMNSSVGNNITLLQNSVDNLEKNLSQTNSNLSTLESNIESWKNSFNINSDDINTKVSNQNETIEQHSTKISKLENTVNSYVINISTNANDISKNKQAIETINNHLSSVITSANGAISTVDTLTTTFNNFKSNDFADLQDKVDDLQMDIIKAGNTLTPKVTQVTISANNSQTITMEDVDFFTKQITMYCLDSEVGSRTNGKWLNTEGVATLAIESKTKLVIYNDYDTALTFKIIIL